MKIHQVGICLKTAFEPEVYIPAVDIFGQEVLFFGKMRFKHWTKFVVQELQE